MAVLCLADRTGRGGRHERGVVADGSQGALRVYFLVLSHVGLDVGSQRRLPMVDAGLAVGPFARADEGSAGGAVRTLDGARASYFSLYFSPSNDLIINGT